jgi:hypothetical protein
MKASVLASCALIVGTWAHAAVVTHSHLGTRAQQDKARQWNRGYMSPMAEKVDWQVDHPFSETETTGYVAISSDDDFELPDLRAAIAKNLPANTTLIIYVADAGEVDGLKQKYSADLGDRLKFVVVPENADADPIWARDSLPFPVYMKSQDGKTFGLVNSLYPQDFEPDAAVAKALSLPMVATHQYFRGGNLLIDSQHNCFAENVNEVADLNDPQSYFKNYFGCNSVNLLAQEGGIGDIDERIKFMDGMNALTDNDAYAKILQDKGYTVHRIPSTGADDETYMNTLLVNGTIFVPQMGIAADKKALDAYNALGLKAVGVMTKQLADDGLGNIHCVTMNYPPGTFTASLRGPDFVEFAH